MNVNATIQADPLSSRILIEMRGRVCYSDFQDLLTEFRARNLLHFDQIYDLRAAEADLDWQQLTMIAHRLKILSSRTSCGRMAVVVRDTSACGLMALLQSLLAGIVMLRSFGSLEEAGDWLIASPEHGKANLASAA